MDNSVEVRILLVDDTPANLVTLEAVLDPLQYDIVKARSGSEALDILKTTDISLVILDVQMPQLDGFDTAKLIKEKIPEKNIPIIFMTAIYQEDPYVHKGYEVGGVDYFGKPFDPVVLKAKVRLHAEMYRQSKLLQKMEKKLEEANHRNKLLLDSVLDILWVTSPDGTLVYLNRAFEDQTGHKTEEWVGKNISSLVRPEDLKDVMRCITETVNEQKIRVIETAILEGSGGYLPVELYTRPFVENGEIREAICVVRRVPVRRAAGRPAKKAPL
jgi:PAS domain S-box-containing protein